MKVGYIRINPTEENYEDILKQFKASKKLKQVFCDKISVKEKKRPEYDKMMNYLRAGDEIVLPEFARFNKTLIGLVKTIEELNSRGIEVISEKEDFNSGTKEGKFKLSVLKSAAEFEKTLIKQRQKEGIAVAKALGKYKGYNEKAIPDDFEDFKDLYRMKEVSISDIAKHYGVSRPTIYKWIRQSDDETGEPLDLFENPEIVEESGEETKVIEKPLIPDDLSIYDEPEVIIEMQETENEVLEEKSSRRSSSSKKLEGLQNFPPRRKKELPEDFEAFRKLYRDEIIDMEDIMVFYNKSRTTIRRWLKLADEEAEKSVKK